MSKKRVTRSDVDWWIKNSPDSPHTQTMIRRLERQEQTSALRRKQLLEAVPQWYDRPQTHYSIHKEAWGDHPGVGYGSGQARAMLERLAKEGVIESIQAEGWNEGVKAYRYVNDGQTPAPPPPPPRKPEEDRIGLITVGKLVEHFRYGLTTNDPGEQQWHLAQIARKLGMVRYLEGLEYEPGTPPAGKDGTMAELPEGMEALHEGDDPWFGVGDQVTISESHDVFPGESGEVVAVGRGTGFYEGQLVYDIQVEDTVESERFTERDLAESE